MDQLAIDTLTRIGPESEWFWSAFSGLVVAMSLLALWRQLRLQTSQKIREDTDMVDKTWESERMMRHRLTTPT